MPPDQLRHSFRYPHVDDVSQRMLVSHPELVVLEGVGGSASNSGGRRGIVVVELLVPVDLIRIDV